MTHDAPKKRRPAPFRFRPSLGPDEPGGAVAPVTRTPTHKSRAEAQRALADSLAFSPSAAPSDGGQVLSLEKASRADLALAGLICVAARWPAAVDARNLDGEPGAAYVAFKAAFGAEYGQLTTEAMQEAGYLVWDPNHDKPHWAITDAVLSLAPHVHPASGRPLDHVASRDRIPPMEDLGVLLRGEGDILDGLLSDPLTLAFYAAKRSNAVHGYCSRETFAGSPPLHSVRTILRLRGSCGNAVLGMPEGHAGAVDLACTAAAMPPQWPRVSRVVDRARAALDDPLSSPAFAGYSRFFPLADAGVRYFLLAHALAVAATRAGEVPVVAWAGEGVDQVSVPDYWGDIGVRVPVFRPSDLGPDEASALLAVHRIRACACESGPVRYQPMLLGGDTSALYRNFRVTGVGAADLSRRPSQRRDIFEASMSSMYPSWQAHTRDAMTILGLM